MIRRFLADNISLPLQDRINHTSILKTRDHLLQTQYWDESEIEKYQLKKIKLLVEHASNHVPYYRELFRKEHIHANDINTFEDFRKIPALTKDIALENHQILVADNINLKRVFKGSTGGTTGTPLPLYWDTNEKSVSWGAYYRWYHWMGLSPGDSMAKVWGTKKVLSESHLNKFKDSLKDFYYNRIRINSFHINETTINEHIRLLNQFKPRFVRGYLSALLDFSTFISENEINLKFTPLALSTTTETVLPPYRKFLEEIWNTKLYDQYGCGECNSIAFECSHHNGMHIASEHVYLEKPANNTEESVPVILTNLDNYAMPFIRYINGDEVVFSNSSCTCGVKLPLLKQVTGRKADYIILSDNSKVHGVFFTDILNEIPEFRIAYAKKFQVIQNVPGEIQFLMESDVEPSQQFINNLKKAFNRYFAKSKIIIKDKLETDASGKFRYIKNNMII